MYFVLSGEGPTDLGVCEWPHDYCAGTACQSGPMLVIIDKLVQAKTGKNFLPNNHYTLVMERHLSQLSKARAIQSPRGLRLSGPKTPKETAYFYRNAQALAKFAQAEEKKRNKHVIAVLFRDCDGTASASRGLWNDKFESMKKGFQAEGFERGVAMVPKPKSEAWLICALKPNSPYQSCAKLEERSGNDNAPNPLKTELAQILQVNATRENLVQATNDHVDPTRISDMASFDAFRNDLYAALSK